MKSVAIITIPNRKIGHGEYGAAFGACDMHKDILMSHMFHMTIVTEAIKGDSLVLTLEKKGPLGKRNIDEINYLCEKGFITDISY